MYSCCLLVIIAAAVLAAAIFVGVWARKAAKEQSSKGHLAIIFFAPLRSPCLYPYYDFSLCFAGSYLFMCQSDFFKTESMGNIGV